MSRSSGTYTAPSGSWNPAVEGTEIDEGDWNTLLDDIESALTESTYTAGLGSTDNSLVRTDGTDTKKVQGSAVTLDDTGNLSGIANLSATGYADVTEMSAPSSPSANVLRLYVADDSGTTRLYAKDSAGTTYTLTTTASAILDAIGSTQGMVLYRGASGWAVLSPGTAGQTLQSGGAGANPAWASTGTGDVVGQASSVDSEIALFSGTGGKTIKRATGSGLAKLTSGVMSIASAGTDYYAPGSTDVAIADGGTGASTAIAAFNALSPLTTQGDILYHNGTNNVRLGPGTAGQVLQSGGAGANPSWATVSGTGDVTSASTISDNRLVRGDGGAKGVQQSGITVDDSDNLTGVGTINGFTVGSSAPSIPQGRLTLSTATPVMTSTTSAATTVYYTPYTGRYVPLYNGSTWTMTDIGGELSQATTDSTKSPAAVATNSNYDLFVWSDSGSYRCTRGPAWSSDTARGTGAGTTELERVNGILVNKVAITNGPAAQRGTYVGTIRSNGSSQIDFQYGAIAANGTPGIVGVWNAYNRVPVAMVVGDSTDSWSYTTTTIRAANNSSTMRVSAICGEAGSHSFEATYIAMSSTTSSGARVGVGYDSTSALDGAIGIFGVTSGVVFPATGSHAVSAGLGWHYFSANERGNTGVTMYGDNATPGTQQSALIVRTMY